jgi:Tol biopolymer transport system component
VATLVGDDSYAVWSPEGSWIAFKSDRKVRGVNDLYRKPSNGAGSEELLLESLQDKSATDWSADGRFVLYMSADPKTVWDLWVLPLDGDRRPRVFLQTRLPCRVTRSSQGHP